MHIIITDFSETVLKINSTENKRQCDVNNGGCSERCETDSSGIGKCVCQPGYKFNRKSEICKGTVLPFLFVYTVIRRHSRMMLLHYSMYKYIII